MNIYKLLRIVCGVLFKPLFRIEYIGRENEPTSGGCIAIANHSSFVDPVAVACALKRPTYFMGKSDFLKYKFMNWVFKVCNVVPVHRGESDIAALRKTCDIITRGDINGIFPQGTRIPCKSPDPSTALAGVGLIAARTKAPILPIAICYGKKNEKPKLFRKLKVVIGKPIPYEEYSTVNGEKANSHDIANYAFSKVCDLFSENNHG